MPRVPVYDGPQVRERPLQPVEQRTPDVSSGVAALGRAVEGLGDLADRRMRRDAEVEANKVDTEVTAGWLEWDAANRPKFKGQNADAYAEEAKKWWDAAKTKYAGVSPLAREQVGLALGRKQNQALASVLGHVNAEKERHADEQSEAAAQTTIEFGIDTGDTAGAAARVRQIAAEKGARKGWATEQVQAEQQRLLGTLHLSAISRMVETDATKARAYYEANKGEIPGQAQQRVEAVLKGEADNQFAQQFAAQHAGKTLEAQLELASGVSDPVRREKTLLAIRQNHAMVKEAQAERERQASDEAWQMVGQGKRVPEMVLQRMDGHGRVVLQDYLKARAKASAEGPKAVKTDPVFLAKIYDLARDDPEAFAKMRMEPLALRISGSDMEQVAALQRKMLTPDKEKDVATTTQLIGAATGGWKPEKRAAFQTAAFDELDRLEKEKGKPLSFKEKREALDRLLVDGEVLSGSWWKNDPNKKFYEATPEERKRFAPTISSDDRKLVIQALQAEGVKNPTDAQITERFKLAKGFR